MSEWKAIQAQKIGQALETSDPVTVTEVFRGRLGGFLYRKQGSSARGVVVAGGFPGGKQLYNTFCMRLASYGFVCIAIDLPSFSGNTEQFSLGSIAELINEAVLFLRQLGAARIAVIGHSTGAIGAVFANAGYNTQIESELYKLWEGINDSVQRYGTELLEGTAQASDAKRDIELRYKRMKEIILYTLQKAIRENNRITALVLIAPPKSLKGCMPGFTLLRALKKPWVKKAFDLFVFRNDKTLKVEDFTAPDVYEFLNYFLNMKEAEDFLTLVEAVANFNRKDNRVTFFKYYLEKYVRAKPKLIIYGRYDIYLRPFLWRRSLENFYRSFGNEVTIQYMKHDHLFRDKLQPGQYITATDADTLIIKFLDSNV